MRRIYGHKSVASFAGSFAFYPLVPRLGCASPGATLCRLLAQAGCEIRLMTVESKLEEAFNAYLNPAKAELCSPRMKTPSQRPVQVLKTRSMELRRLVDQIRMLSGMKAMLVIM